jgi:hypothetical protein
MDKIFALGWDGVNLKVIMLIMCLYSMYVQ